MSYTTSCECGRTYPVNASQAGTELNCSCGRRISVPLLSELRRSAGQRAYETSTIDEINRMLRDGDLPTGDLCVLSGTPTREVYNLYVQCETKWIKGRSISPYVLVVVAFAVLAPFVWLLSALAGKDLLGSEEREVGRDRGVLTPLRVHPDFRDKLRRIRSQAKLRALLCTVPVYAKLLKEFPKAKIST
jgi:hypothetical protein